MGQVQSKKVAKYLSEKYHTKRREKFQLDDVCSCF